MAVGVKLLVVGASLAATSCGGYVVYKNVTSSNSEKTNAPEVNSDDGKKVNGDVPSTNGAALQPANASGPSQKTLTPR